MRLTLVVNNTASLEGGAKATFVFDEDGGSIGSSETSSWRLLNLIKAQSRIYEDQPADAAKLGAEQIAKAVVAPEPDDNRDQGQRIARSFARLSQIVTANGKDKPYFEELQGALQNLEAYMREIKSGEASNKPVALDKAQARANLTGDDPIYVLRRISANLPPPLNRLLTKLADQCWKVELASAKRDLQALWQDQVYRQFYVDLATRYPFNRNSKEDVSLDQFTRFFGPKGTFDAFARDHLTIFINADTNEPVVIDGRTLDVSSSFVDQLKQVRKIRDIFFDANGSPTLHYSLEPLSLSGTAARSVLNIEGQLVPYSHGPTRPIQILWPNALSSQQNMSQFSVFGANFNSGAANLTFQGLWSGFRLLDRAAVSGVQPDGATLSFSIGDQRALYRLRIAGPENPFVSEALRKLKLPETL
jgi:type VI secretion system protein ImpL